MRRFRNRLRGLRDRWRHGTVTRAEVEQRILAWIAHADHAQTWRVRHAGGRGAGLQGVGSLGQPSRNVRVSRLLC